MFSSKSQCQAAQCKDILKDFLFKVLDIGYRKSIRVEITKREIFRQLEQQSRMDICKYEQIFDH